MEEIKYENVHHSTNIPPMKLIKQAAQKVKVYTEGLVTYEAIFIISE